MALDMTVEDVLERMARARLTRQRVALRAGWHPSQMTCFLNGTRKLPKDFFPRVLAAIEVEVAADRAAKRAYEQSVKSLVRSKGVVGDGGPA